MTVQATTSPIIYTLPRYNVGWRWDLLTIDEQPLGALDNVKDGRLELSIYNTVRGQGGLSWSGTDVLDWEQYRVQPWYTADTAMGHIEWPLGVYLMNGPSRTYEDTGIDVQVDLYDKLLVLDQTKVRTTTTYPAGTVVTTALRTLLANYPVAITDSPETLTVPQSFPVNTSLLQIANALLKTINYFSLSADGYGVFRADHYTAPAYRAVEWEFEDSKTSIYKPGFVEESDLWDVPNIVTLQARNDGVGPILTSTARNDDPNSPTSTVRRKREIDYYEDNVEATSQAILDSMAYRRLLDLSTKALTVQCDHAPLPLDLNDAVTFVNKRREIEHLCVIQSMTLSSAAGSTVQSKLLEVHL